MKSTTSSVRNSNFQKNKIYHSKGWDCVLYIKQTKHYIEISCDDFIDRIPCFHSWSELKDQLLSCPRTPLPKNSLGCIFSEEGPPEHKKLHHGFVYCALLVGKSFMSTMSAIPILDQSCLQCPMSHLTQQTYTSNTSKVLPYIIAKQKHGAYAITNPLIILILTFQQMEILMIHQPLCKISVRQPKNMNKKQGTCSQESRIRFRTHGTD